jgi:16S rRNA (guanine527-N7)-methyltransferase
LPGLVLKAWEPKQEITLVEGSRKKAVFLDNVVRELGLGPVEIHVARVETLLSKGTLRGEFDVLFARAVTGLAESLRVFGPVLRQGGRIITFKGPTWSYEVEEAKRDGVLTAGAYRLEQVVCVPWAPAHLLSLRKEG